uniref:Uncharacterized protein n=1 Tax=Arundo donax TaxID=35708 RepID=A0A0A8Y440_ARUDO
MILQPKKSYFLFAIVSESTLLKPLVIYVITKKGPCISKISF